MSFIQTLADSAKEVYEKLTSWKFLTVKVSYLSR